MNMDSERLTLIGGTGSPYTRKMVALLRYRRIPYRIIWGDPAAVLDEWGIAKPRPTFHPTFLFSATDDDGDGAIEALCDSSPIIRRLEQGHGERSVIPSDPALAFLDMLLEDFADEWCTKYMFHYRWYPDKDADNAGTILPLSMDVTLKPELLSALKKSFAERQTGRLYVVGSNDITAPVIDASYRRFLVALEANLAHQPYLMGRRPGASDFAMFGQLSQLIGFDPTPRAIAHELAPRAVAWVSKVEDLCGLEPRGGDWLSMEEVSASLGALLQEVGRVYLPVMQANANAVRQGQESWSMEIDSVEWQQKTFPYQAKCLYWLREAYAALAAPDRHRVDAVLQDSGCQQILASDD